MGGYVSPGIGLQRSRSIADLIMRRGDIAAQRAMMRGNIWGNALNNLGQTISGAIQQHGERKNLEKRAEAFGALMEDPKVMEDPRYAMNALVKAGYEPDEAFQFARGFKIFGDSMREEKPDIPTALEYAQKMAPIYLRADEATQARMRPGLAQWAGWAGLDPEGTLAQSDAPTFNSLVQSLVSPQEGPEVGSDEWLSTANPEEIEALRRRRNILEPPAPEGPDTRSLEVQLAEAAASGDQQRYNLLLKAKRDIAAAGRPAEPPAGETARKWSKPYKGDNGRWYQYDESGSGEVRLANNMGRELAQEASKNSRAQAQQKVESLLGTPEGGDPDSLYQLVLKNTLPGGELMATAVGTGATVTDWFRMPARANLELYQSQKEGFIPLLARAVGHTGVLTEQDVKRSERLLPVLTGPYADSREVAVRKLERLRRIMNGEEKVGADFFDPQEGHWPPSGGGAIDDGEIIDLTEPG